MRTAIAVLTVLAGSLGQLGCGWMPPPPRFASGPSCPRILALEAIDGALTGVIMEDARDTGFLGIVRQQGSSWRALEPATYRANHFTTASISMTPAGDAFAALHPSDQQLPTLRRSTALGWETVPFHLAVADRTQVQVTAVALDAERAVLDLWENDTSGTGAPPRTRAFLQQGGQWVPVEDYRPSHEHRGFHRGPAGELWRATYPTTDAGRITFHQWNGRQWAPTGKELPVTERGFLRWLFHEQGRLFAVYETSRCSSGCTAFTLYEWAAGRPVAIAQSPTHELWLVDVAFDSRARPMVMMRDRKLVRWYLLDHGAWSVVFEMRPRRRHLLNVEAAVVGDRLVVARTESDQEIAPTFQHYSDCELLFERADLRSE